VFICGLLALAWAQTGPWQQLGPNGANAGAVVAIPGNRNDVAFITSGFPARVYYSSDCGNVWLVRDSIPDLVSCVCGDPNSTLTLYCAGPSGEVRRSTDAGRTWSVRGTLAAGSRPVRLVAVDASPTELWLLCGADTSLSVFRSVDAGQNWVQQHAVSGTEASADFLTIDPVHPARVFFGGSKNNNRLLLYSPNSGTSWYDLSSGPHGTHCYDLAVARSDSSVMICATDTGIYRTTSMGASWQLRSTVPTFTVGFAPISPYPLLAVGDNLLLRSGNQGITWTADSVPFFGTGKATVEYNSGLITEYYIGNGAGLLFVDEDSVLRTDRTESMNHLDVRLMVPDPHAGDIVHAVVAGAGLMRSVDKGRTWTRLNQFPGAGAATGLAVCSRSPDTLLAVTPLDPYLHLYTAGAWQSYEIQEFFSPRSVAYHPLDADTVFVGGAWRDSLHGKRRFCVMRSADRGLNWSTFYLPTFLWTGNCLGFDPTGRAETLFAWGARNDSAVILRSTDRGSTWTRRDNGITGRTVRSFYRAGFDSTTFFCLGDAGAYRSENAGLSWLHINLDNVSCVLPDTTFDDAFACGTDTQGVFVTTNAGVTWLRDTVQMRSRSVLSLVRLDLPGRPALCGTRGASALGHGVIGIQEPEAGATPIRPAWPTLTADKVKLMLAPGVKAALDLYAADGRLIQRQEFIPAGREYVWTRPRGVPAGAYLLVVRDGTRTVTKLILR